MRPHTLCLLAVFIPLALLSIQPAAAQTITSTSESHPYPGVRLVEGRTSGPATDFHAAFISLCNDYVHVDASSYNGARTAGSWASGAGAQLAVNGDFFTYSGGAHIYGDAVAGGSRWPSIRTGRDSSYSGDWYYERYGWIAFGDDWVEFSNTEWVKQNRDELGATGGWNPHTVTKEIPAGTQALVSGFPQLVVGGRPIECSSPTASSCFPDRTDMRTRHPRTAMGLSEDRQTFILVVVDGRSSRSEGMYGAELAQLMGELGAHTGFNLDGGGSTQMWVSGQSYVNQPSDGSPRGTFNHWGVFAGSGHSRGRLPGSCDHTVDGVYHQPAGQLSSTRVDLDGDGRADACIRTPDGFECHLSSGDGFTSAGQTLGLQDSSGWGDVTNYGTLRMGDVDGDGRADVCARANAEIICWRWQGDRFEELARGPDWSDDSGFDKPQYFTTFRLADVTGDGRDDVCIRTRDRFVCHGFDAGGFGAAINGPELKDEWRWDRPDRFGTIRMGDVTGDGRMDVCARRAEGFACWPSQGDSFGARIDGPGWSDDDGWTQHRYWSTIRLADIDDDGRADVCARGPDGVRCHLSTGDGFGAAIEGPSLSDDSGWDDPSNYATLRLADVTGDGLLDVCARANAGMRCWPFDGSGFGSAFGGPMVDDSGWYRERFYRTIQFADIDGDGKADLCARSSQALVCWRSLGDSFDDTIIEGPAWADSDGFDHPRYYSTMRLTGPIGPVDDEPEPGDDTGTAPGDDTGSGPDDTGTTGDPDATPDGDTGAGAADTGAGSSDIGGLDDIGPGDATLSNSTSTGSCACTSTPPAGSAGWLVIGLAGLFMVRRRA